MAARPSRPALGRGLAALLGDMTVAPPGAPLPVGGAVSGMRQIPLDLLDPNPFQPRMKFDQAALEELAASIRARGVLQPILARAHPTKADRFYIVAGERRWRAAALAGLHEVPAIVRDMTDAEAGVAALIENLQREDLNPIEEAEGYSRLLDELELTQEMLAEAVGKSRTHVTNILRLLNLPPGVQTEVRKGTLSFGHARALLAHPDPEALAATVFKGGLTVRQTEALAARAQSGSRKPGDRRAASADMAALEQRLTERLGLKARVSTGRQGRVSVVLDFADVRQLEAWMEGLAA
ncbi:MAG TPA: ParB/RepB/Spo0J family partition protein [Acetobacteraceae bacterium]|nr:ParB/RepB/Spo0J family partition protein [Acetobacteraceae bacterium]